MLLVVRTATVIRQRCQIESGILIALIPWRTKEFGEEGQMACPFLKIVMLRQEVIRVGSIDMSISQDIQYVRA